MPDIVKENILFHPINISFFGLQTITASPHNSADLIK